MIRGVAFDLDDTLYLERDFVRSGYGAVARTVAERIQVPRETIFRLMWDRFVTGNRDAFDTLLSAYSDAKRHFTVEQLIQIYRNHRPALRLPEESRRLLLWLRRKGFLIGIVSDGYLETQRAKITALGLDSLVDLIVLTDEWGRECWKPHWRGYETVAKAFGLPNRALCYVGDNPAKDFRAPRALGWYTIRVRRSGQVHCSVEPASVEDSPHVTVNSVKAVREELGRANASGGAAPISTRAL